MRPAETDAARTGQGAAAAKRTRVARSEDTGRRTLSTRGTYMKKTSVLTALLAGMCASAFAAQVKLGADFGAIPEYESNETESSSQFNLHEELHIGYKVQDIPFEIEGNIGLNQGVLGGKSQGVNASASAYFYGFGLMVGFPVEISSLFTISPRIGLNRYNFISAKAESGGSSESYKRSELQDKDSLDFTAIKFGVAGDFNTTQNVFIRGQFLYNFEIAKDTKSFYGPSFSIGAGYKFL
jgi:hypothetical protein